MRKISLLLLSIALLPVSLAAHDLYLLPAQFQVLKGSVLQVAFHNGDSFPASEVAPKVARLLEAAIAGNAGRAAIQNLKIAGKETLGDVKIPGDGTLLISVRTPQTFIELDPKKFEAYLKEEGLTEVMDYRKENKEEAKAGRERYSKYAKSLITAGTADDYFGHEMGFPIEILPLVDPGTVKPGAKLPVRILFRGRPAVGMQIESAWASGTKGKTLIVGRTDIEGRIEVPLAEAGMWRLHALKMERCADQKVADWESFWASLTFEVK